MVNAEKQRGTAVTMQKQSTYKTANDIVTEYPMCRTTIYRLIQRGEFPKPVKFGQRSYWKSDEIEAAIEKLEAKRFN